MDCIVETFKVIYIDLSSIGIFTECFVFKIETTLLEERKFVDLTYEIWL